MGELLKFQNRPTQEGLEIELELSDLLAEIGVELLDKKGSLRCSKC